MKLKSIFLSIFIFAFAVATPLTQVFADTEVIVSPGEEIYEPIISIDDTLGDIVIPGILGAILYYGGEVAFGEPITYDSLIDSFNSAARSFDWYDIEKEILRRSPANDLIQWKPDNPQESVESWESLLKKCSDFWLDNLAFQEQSEIIQPEVPDGLESLIDRINGGGFWWKYYENNSYSYNGQSCFALNTYPPSLSSWFVQVNNAIPDTAPTGSYPYIGGITSQPIHDIYITSLNGVYYYNESITALKSNSHWNNRSQSERFGTPVLYGDIYTLGYNHPYGSTVPFVSSTNRIDSEIYSYNVSGTLYEVLYYIGSYFRNVNIYVDNVPISIVGQNTNQYYITTNTYIQNSDVPIMYEVPDGTYFDYVKMKNYIISAINNSGILKYEDIEDCFVDINGVTALYTVQVQRNDFDNMFDELYSPIYFPKFSVDTQIQPDIQNGVTIINNAVGIIPDDILKVLVYGCSITLFAFLVKKLIE